MHTDTWIIPKEVYAARIEGRCVCGAVHWSYDAPLATMLFCHCSVCRKHHGTLFATYVSGPLSTFHWRAGTEQIRTWQSSAAGKRSFCSACGSKVPNVGADQVFMPAGALEGELGIRPQAHLFVGSKPAWHMLSDGLPKHDAYPPEWKTSGVENPVRPVREGVVSGSCACGRMHFEIDGRPLLMRHCHCSRCRHARGSAHATNLAYKLDALRFTVGEILRHFVLRPLRRRNAEAFPRARLGGGPRRLARLRPANAAHAAPACSFEGSLVRYHRRSATVRRVPSVTHQPR
jgi:hypothetical protein